MLQTAQAIDYLITRGPPKLLRRVRNVEDAAGDLVAVCEHTGRLSGITFTLRGPEGEPLLQVAPSPADSDDLILSLPGDDHLSTLRRETGFSVRGERWTIRDHAGNHLAQITEQDHLKVTWATAVEAVMPLPIPLVRNVRTYTLGSDNGPHATFQTMGRLVPSVIRVQLARTDEFIDDLTILACACVLGEIVA